MYLEVALRSRVGNYTKSFLEIGMDSVRQVGGKAASLGELSKAGFPVPPGFAIIGQAFIDFRGKQISDEFMNEVMEQFDLLSTEYVSVRSSALAEDGVDASWAGQMETYLNVTRNQVIEKIRECWDSADSERAKVYAEQNSTKSEDLVVGVVVQKMIDSEVAGVMFTRNPVSGDDAELLIEAAYGLGEGVVSGEITPDSYIVNRDTLKLANLSVYKQNQMVARVNGQTIMIDVRSDLAQQQKLDEITILSLAEIGLAIEKHYVSPQDVEWAAVEGAEDVLI
jgi:pyruvate,water dikinase